MKLLLFKSKLLRKLSFDDERLLQNFGANLKRLSWNGFGRALARVRLADSRWVPKPVSEFEEGNPYA